MEHGRMRAFAATAFAATFAFSLTACTSSSPSSAPGAGDASTSSIAGTAPTSASTSSSAPGSSLASSPSSSPASTSTTSPSPTAPPTTVFTCRRTPSSWDDNVRFGDCDDHSFVLTIEERLNILGFPCTEDNQFRADTDAAVRNFQRARGLTVDGQVGPITWAALVEGGIGD